MRHLNTGIIGFILGTAIFALLSLRQPLDERFDELFNSDKSIENSMCELENSLLTEIDSLKKVLQDPYLMAYRYKKDRAKFIHFLHEEKQFPSTPFMIRHHLLDRADISVELLAGLIAFGQSPTAPKEDLIVSSVVRKGNKRSEHYHGNAIDISKVSANKLLDWIKTEDGECWMNEYQLQVYIEDNYRSKFLASWAFLDNLIFLNPNASGPHVHIAYIGRKSKMIEKES